MDINPLHAIDFYKTDHRRQYPQGTNLIYANFTPRHSRLPGINKAVFFGLQYFINDYLNRIWDRGFFKQNKEFVAATYKRRLDTSLGKDAVSLEHIKQLHDIGFLPIQIKALPEGTLVPMGVPVLTIQNTHPNFFWLTNYIESILSCYLWQPSTAATIAFEYKKLLTRYAIETGTPLDFVQFQAHDFSFRGKSGPQDAAMSGAAHLTSFVGTDSILAIDFLEDYYLANADQELIGCSVPATEHSVMCMGGKENELETFRRLINMIYPTGIVSIVSDSWDFWKVITEYIPLLKDEILARTGKVVIRPDSGDPVKIICGDREAVYGSSQYKGAIECLWEIFGGTETQTGHKLLNSHIGLIYGDSITLERANQILVQLKMKGFASGNVVLGIGSYTYQYMTRDSLGWAVKATYGEVNGIGREIFKDPMTDCGIKKSAKGLLRVEEENGTLVLYDQQTKEQENQGLLKTVFINGKRIQQTSLAEIRARLQVEA